MKKILNLIDKIKYEHLEYFSFILLLFWAISPTIEYVFKYYFSSLYKSYFTIAIYFIGIFGLLEYLVYYIKQKKDKQVSKKRFLCEILILILFVLGIIATIFSKNPKLSIFGEYYRKEGLLIYLMYIGFILSASMIKSENYKRNLFRIIIFNALIIVILPFFRNNFTYAAFSNVFHQFNHYGYYLMIAMMLSVFMFIDNDKFKKIFYLLVYIMFLYFLIRNDTFGCYLASFISLIILFIYSLIKKYKRISVISVLVIFVLVSFCVSHFDIKIGERLNFNNTSGIVSKNITSLFKDVDKVLDSKNGKKINDIGTWRGYLWKKAFSYTMEHPLVGGGMESLNEYYHSQDSFINDRPHNIFLQISSFIGIPGAIVYLILILVLAFNNLKNIKKDTINIMIYFTAMTYFISSIFGNSMYYTSPYFMILLGLLISIYKENVKEKVK